MPTEEQKELRPASFRGVKFSVVETQHTVGRRVVVHEYPQRDTPYTEDLGKAAREFTIKGIISGNGYIQRMNALEEKLAMPGAGELIHPRLGRLMVVPNGKANITYSSSVSSVEFDLKFVEAGERLYPTQSVDTGYVSKQSAQNLFDASLDSIQKKLNIIEAQDFIKQSVINNLNSVLKIDALGNINKMFKIADSVGRIVNEGISLLSQDPTSFAHRLANSLGLGSAVNTVNSWRGVVFNVNTLLGDRKLNSNESSRYTEGTQDHIEATNIEAFNALVRQVQISNAVGASANVGTEKDRVNETEPVKVMAYDDLINLRDSLCESIDQEMEKVDDDEVFLALQESRIAVWNDLTNKANDSVRLIDYTPTVVLPALVIAYDYYEDATREAELVGRNNIRRPLFVPANKPLKLLSQ